MTVSKEFPSADADAEEEMLRVPPAANMPSSPKRHGVLSCVF